MTTDPLIAAALLGSARMTALPPPPDPSLESTWQAIATENPAAAILQALALTRALHYSGTRSQVIGDSESPCLPESRETLPGGAVDALMRLLNGEFPEALPEALRLALASGRVLPGRVLPELLTAATRNHALRPAIPLLVGERGLWIARRHRKFSWLLEGAVVPDDAWDGSHPALRIAWLRQTRATDPSRAAAAISAQWPGEDASMRESILRVVAESPQPCDEAWLQALALKDRRQDIRELAAAALSTLADAGFRSRAIARVRERVKIERRLLKRVIAVKPPDSFDPAWEVDGIKEKPPQGTGEKAWWLRQMIALVPLEDWPEMLGVKESELFTLAIDPDWQEPLLLGWIDSARRMPGRASATQFLKFITRLDPWPPSAAAKGLVMAALLDALAPAYRFAILDELAMPLATTLDLLVRCGEPPPKGKGKATLALLDAASLSIPTGFNRQQAPALAVCIPHDGIQPRLEALAKLPELSAAAEEFATTLEFRRSLISHFKLP
ncbi:MAG: DUF5691 domain-containing protein [Verrucomicrobiota bacterium]